VSKQIGIFHCAAIAAALGLAAQCQAGTQTSDSLLTAFNPGPVGRYCGGIAQEDMGCLQQAPEAVSAAGTIGQPRVMAEFDVGKMVAEGSQWHASWNDVDSDSGVDAGHDYAHDLGQWLMHGKGAHRRGSGPDSHDNGNGYGDGYGDGHGDGMGSPPICDPTPVPLPSGFWLLASGMFAGIILRHRRSSATQM